MKKLFYLGVCIVLAMGVGCATTNYALITDNNQVKQAGGIGATVNTSGKAHIREGIQIATLYPDGADNLFSFVDQKANGDRTLTTYNNWSPSYPIFHSDFYCNPDWQGCSVITSSDPEVGDVDNYDYKANWGCITSFNSISYVVNSSRYYGECGRSLDKYATLINMLEKRGDSYYFLMTPANTSALFHSKNDGTTTALGLNFDIPIRVQGKVGDMRMTLDVTNPLQSALANQINQIVSQHGSAFRVQLQINGMNKNLNGKFLPSLTSFINR